ncbi:MAG TPA: hypothetical protein VLI41_02765 [Phenylobacterium sp.]|uniref:hypothetical protein n=1 Tax=Phenylobacterium sp. TaxID=1871053 RepID=UPI002B9AEAB1|nr:hypothetical protein [Phenylobacterium sp.]HSV02103.1 hypothetical protein [Phenylobacterium sp.]
MNRFSASEAALEGFRLTRERPGTVLAWSGLYFVGVLIIALVMMASLDPHFIELAKKGQLLNRDPEEIGAMLASSLPAFLLVVLLTIVLFSTVMGGIYRLVLRPQEHGFAHLRFGRDELRLTAVNLLLFGMGMACLTFGIGVIALAESASPLAGFLVGAAVVAATIWLGVKLSLATPMSFATHRIAIRSAWRLTGGRRFWELLGMIVLALIFYFIVWILVTIIDLAVVTAAGGQQNVQAASSPVAFIGFVATLIIQLVLPILQVIMVYSPLAVAYQQLTDEAPPARTADA